MLETFRTKRNQSFSAAETLTQDSTLNLLKNKNTPYKHLKNIKP
jgi:hypothetical protein